MEKREESLTSEALTGVHPTGGLLIGELMSERERQLWFQRKAHRIECYQQWRNRQALEEAGDVMEAMVKDPEMAGATPQVFLDTSTPFNAVLAGSLLNDYEVEILRDLEAREGGHLYYRLTRLELRGAGGQKLKVYEIDHLKTFPFLLQKELLEEQAVEQWVLNSRGVSALQVAKELAQKEVEQWESWRGLPNLYYLNDREL